MGHRSAPAARTRNRSLRRRGAVALLAMAGAVGVSLTAAEAASADTGGNYGDAWVKNYGGGYADNWTKNYNKDHGKAWGGGTSQKRQLADVRVNASGPSHLDHDQEQRWVVEITNGGRATAKNVRSSTTMPNGIKYVAHRISQGHATETLTGDGRIALNVGDLAPGKTIRLEIVGKAPSHGGGTVRLANSVTTSSQESSTGNNAATVLTRIA
ncbi:hypothetical protein [Streptomyces sp. NPDC050264]|uniref:hypothetical protein n=1 Tax=Streptomyces sp. NPDC050264 TaxID=3155038 RepID=UPI003414605C